MYLLVTAALHIPQLGSKVGGDRDGEPHINNMANKNPTKRKLVRLDSDSDLSVDNVPRSDHWPRFIIIESADSDRPISKLSPFAIHKGILGIAGTEKDVRKLRSGQLLVECAMMAHAENLLKAKTLAGVSIKASRHRTLNSSKGAIRTRSLEDTPEDEILAELREQGVSDVRRLTIKKDGKSIQTGTYFLTFDRPTPPGKLAAGYLKVDVSLYIPNPLRCFKCQKFGHDKDNCRGSQCCVRCGQNSHDSTDCQLPEKCSNCQGDHMATLRNCPVWKKKKSLPSKPKRRSAFQRPGSWWRGPLLPQLPICMRPLLSLPPGHLLVRPS